MPDFVSADWVTEAQLIDLNHRVVERLLLLQHLRAHVDMLEFKDRRTGHVQLDGREPVQGMLVRYNRKPVTVVINDGHRWNVSPSLLSRAIAPAKA